MRLIELDSDNRLTFRETPWDEATFGFRCNEIINIQASDEVHARELLVRFENTCSEDHVVFSYTRIPAQSQMLKSSFHHSGFYITECLVHVELNLEGECPFRPELKSLRLSLDEATEEDIPHLRKLIAESFDYGRMHEDFMIPEELARLRYARWIDELRAQNKLIVVHRKKGLPIFFEVYEFKPDATVNVVVGGSGRDFGMCTFAMAATAFEYLKKRGCKRLQTAFSAANLGIFNYYMSLGGYRVLGTSFGCHKHRDFPR